MIKNIILFVLVILASASNDANAVQMMGVRSCGQWIEGRSTRDSRTFSIDNEAWLLGFLSGMAFESSNDILSGLDNKSIYLWVDNYCRANPLEKLFRAAEVFENEVKKRR